MSRERSNATFELAHPFAGMSVSSPIALLGFDVRKTGCLASSGTPHHAIFCGRTLVLIRVRAWTSSGTPLHVDERSTYRPHRYLSHEISMGGTVRHRLCVSRSLWVTLGSSWFGLTSVAAGFDLPSFPFKRSFPKGWMGPVIGHESGS